MPWAIYSDYSGVVEMDDHGIHPTELKAIEAQLLALESHKTEITTKISRAKSRRRQLNRRKP